MLAVEGRSVRVARHLDVVAQALEEGAGVRRSAGLLRGEHMRSRRGRAARRRRPPGAGGHLFQVARGARLGGPREYVCAGLRRPPGPRGSPLAAGGHVRPGRATPAGAPPGLGRASFPFDPGTHARHGRWLLSRGRREALAALIRRPHDPRGYAREVKRVVAAWRAARTSRSTGGATIPPAWSIGTWSPSSAAGARRTPIGLRPWGGSPATAAGTARGRVGRRPRRSARQMPGHRPLVRLASRLTPLRGRRLVRHAVGGAIP